MSQEQNPPTILNSPSDQEDSVAVAKPFSIREYVYGCRKKNMFNNWPFPKKYLQMCLDSGLTTSQVLPPFEGISNDFGHYIVEGNNEASKSNAIRKGAKRRKGRMKIKKRPIMDIFAATPRCTQEEIDRVYEDWYTLTGNDDDQTHVAEGSSHHEIVSSRNLSTSNEAEPANTED